jgi:sulfoxide reductase heme-binding subunit YedZ
MLSLIGAIPLGTLPAPLVAIIEADSGLDHAIWFGARALGLVAFGLATASVVLGISTSTRVGDKIVGRGSIADVHRVLALLTVTALAGHILLLVLNRYMAFGPVEVLVPFAASYRPVWTAAGVVAAYLLLAVFGSFYVRGLLGYRTWRTLHYATFGVFVAASLHGILSGTDSGTSWARLFYAGAMSAVALAVIYRLLRGIGPRALWAWREEAGDPGLFRTVAAAAVLTVGISLAIILPFSLAQSS